MVSVGKAFWKKGLQHKGFYHHSGAFSSKGWCSGCSNFFRCSEMLFGAFWVQLNIEIQETKDYRGRSSSLKRLWLKFVKKWAPTWCFVLNIFLVQFWSGINKFHWFLSMKWFITHLLMGYIVIFLGSVMTRFLRIIHHEPPKKHPHLKNWPPGRIPGEIESHWRDFRGWNPDLYLGGGTNKKERNFSWKKSWVIFLIKNHGKLRPFFEGLSTIGFP